MRAQEDGGEAGPSEATKIVAERIAERGEEGRPGPGRGVTGARRSGARRAMFFCRPLEWMISVLDLSSETWMYFSN